MELSEGTERAIAAIFVCGGMTVAYLVGTTRPPEACAETFRELQTYRGIVDVLREDTYRAEKRAREASEDNAKLRTVIDLKEKQRENLEAALKAERAK